LSNIYIIVSESLYILSAFFIYFFKLYLEFEFEYGFQFQLIVDTFIFLLLLGTIVEDRDK